MEIVPTDRMLFNLSRQGPYRTPELAQYNEIKRTVYLDCLIHLAMLAEK